VSSPDSVSAPELAGSSEFSIIAGSATTDHLGAVATEEGVNFAVYSETASALFVSVYDELDREIGRFEMDVHQDNVHAVHIANLRPGARYGFRADGPYDPAQGYHFDPNKLLVDPYARRIDRVFVRSPRLRLPREDAVDTAPLIPKGIVVGERNEPAAPNAHRGALFYELNVRGFTMRHPGVQGPLRGTIAGLTTQRVIDHFKYLGVDTIQLMPTAAWIDDGHLPALGLTNAWGYNPATYFAIDPRLAPRGPQELRVMTDLYRENGINVILDVVYNHTGEGDALGPVLSMKGLDARTYYRHVEVDGVQHLVNDTGTGNTLRCDHPAVQRLVVESLKYWIEELGVSGFRFDLAPVLGREPAFNPDAQMLQMIRNDPVLKNAILVAEPWDPGPGGYQLGQFGEVFQEHNDTFRDEIRAFWRGEDGKIGALAGKVAGSAEVFNHAGRKPSHGVNLLAVHDGFTLRDLVSYNDKHNEANGENNKDGHNHNSSWNCGVEGETDDETIIAARKRDVRALLTTLFVSRGSLLIQQGDEMWRTQEGNNNAYAQDNEISWVDWENADGELVDFVAGLHEFRKAQPALHADEFLTNEVVDGKRSVVWWHPEGHEMSEAEWADPGASVLGTELFVPDSHVIVWFNRRVETVKAKLPEGKWSLGFRSGHEDAPVADDVVELPLRSVVILLNGPTAG
jgi:glycogen operon protein